MKILYVLMLALWVPIHANAQTEAQATFADDAAQDASHTVPVGFADELDGDLWDDILHSAPEHALYFLFLKHKFDAGHAVDVRNAHTTTQFRPTVELVELMKVDPWSPQVEELALPLHPNQILKVEVRGRLMDNDRVQLTLTTVLETASASKVVSEQMYSRVYHLAKMEEGGEFTMTSDGQPAARYRLHSAHSPL